MCMDEIEDPLSGPTGGRQELEAIIERASFHRRSRVLKLATLTAVVALGAGTGIGYAAWHQPAPQTVVSGPASSGSTVPYPNGAFNGGLSSPLVGTVPVGGVTAVPAEAFRMSRIFDRQAGAIAIRGFEVGNGSESPPLPGPPCGQVVQPEMTAELSTPGMVGMVTGFRTVGASVSKPVMSTDGEYLGLIEGDPVAVIVVQTSKEVTDVRATFAGSRRATDHMAPVKGWAVLAAELPAGTSPSKTLGTVDALGAGGKVLETLEVPYGTNALQSGPPAGPSSCPCSSLESPALSTPPTSAPPPTVKTRTGQPVQPVPIAGCAYSVSGGWAQPTGTELPRGGATVSGGGSSSSGG